MRVATLTTEGVQEYLTGVRKAAAEDKVELEITETKNTARVKMKRLNHTVFKAVRISETLWIAEHSEELKDERPER